MVAALPHEPVCGNWVRSSAFLPIQSAGSQLGPLLKLEHITHIADTDQLWIVDGASVSVRDQTVDSSSRTYRFSANGQVIDRGRSRLAELRLWPTTARRDRAADDGAYLNCEMVVPHRPAARQGGRQHHAPQGACTMSHVISRMKKLVF
jgi:hypothetical protein